MDYFCSLQLQQNNYINKFNCIHAALTEPLLEDGAFPSVGMPSTQSLSLNFTFSLIILLIFLMRILLL